MTRKVRMFSAELNGDLIVCHMDSTARGVREQVAENVGRAWGGCQREGWRVVSVKVERVK